MPRPQIYYDQILQELLCRVLGVNVTDVKEISIDPGELSITLIEGTGTGTYTYPYRYREELHPESSSR